MTRALLLLTAIVAALQVEVAAAVVVSEAVPVVGGTTGVARVLQVDPVPEPARFVAELTRLIYASSKGENAATDLLRERLRTYLGVVHLFQSMLATVQPPGGGIALARASNKKERNGLEAFLEFVGLRLSKTKGVYRVEPTDYEVEAAAARVRFLSDLGIDLEPLMMALNRGETVRIEVPTELVPVPLTAEIWGRAVWRKSTAAADLFPAIMSDRQAALVCHGLAALDDETLQFIAEHPEILTRLYEHDAPVFAVFGGSLQVQDGRIVPPGGALAVPLWETVLNEQTTRPDRFIRELFGQADGRIAFLYDALAGLDPSTSAFALGLWIEDEGVRTERFKALVSIANGAYVEWRVPIAPFSRPPYDIVSLLTRVQADERGAPTLASRLLWSRAFESLDLPDEQAGQLKDVADKSSIDAAWLAEATLGGNRETRRDRLDQFAFGQRVFGSADERAWPDVLVALRAFPRGRMLMLTLERMGVRTPAVYAAAARQAVRLSALDANRGFVALAQFQSALALLTRMAVVRGLDAAKAEALVSSLVELRLNEDGRYMGAVARWLQQKLAPALGGADDLEGVILTALAGVASSEGGRAKPVSWDGQPYRVDLGSAELRRLRLVRGRQGGYSVDVAAQLGDVASRLVGDRVTLEDTRASAARLQTLVDAFAPKKTKRSALTVLPPGVDPPRNALQILDRAVQDLSEIGKPEDIKRARRVGEALLELTDTVLGEVLLSLAYAIDLGEPEGPTLLGSNVAMRHDFGLAWVNGEQRLRKAWAMPGQVVAPGVPWRVSGSALGLDVALATLALRRVATDSPLVASRLGLDVQDAFAASVALMNPLALRDADRDAIAEAVQRGRAAVAAVADGGAADAMTKTIRMDGWRRRAYRWTVARDPARAASLFSMTELLVLGGAPVASFDAWGMAALASSGCLCTRLAPPGRSEMSTGRVSELGLLAAAVADLHLHVAVMLHDFDLPAAIARAVLAVAVNDFIHEATPTDANDWLALVRAAQAVSRERIDDYVSAVLADGPLVLDEVGGDRPPVREPR